MLEIVNQRALFRSFWLLFLMTLSMLVVMQITNAPLITEAASGGIITFELVGTLEGSQAIIQSWEGEAMTWAGLNMGLDFLFLVLYGTTIALACMLLSHRMVNSTMKRVGVWLAYGVLVAALLDVIENIALIQLLLGSERASLPLLAKWMAIPKFLLVLLSLLYVIIGVTPLLKKT